MARKVKKKNISRQVLYKGNKKWGKMVGTRKEQKRTIGSQILFDQKGLKEQAAFDYFCGFCGVLILVTFSSSRLV